MFGKEQLLKREKSNMRVIEVIFASAVTFAGVMVAMSGMMMFVALFHALVVV